VARGAMLTISYEREVPRRERARGPLTHVVARSSLVSQVIMEKLAPWLSVALGINYRHEIGDDGGGGGGAGAWRARRYAREELVVGVGTEGTEVVAALWAAWLMSGAQRVRFRGRSP